MPRRPLLLLALALLTACGALAVWVAAFVVPGGRALDATAMQTFTGVARPPLQPSIHGVAVLADPAPFLAGVAALTALALLRRRWLMALIVPGVLLGANLATQLLKPALADPRVLELLGTQVIYAGSWPSGHATASMSLALGLVLVVGRRLRPVAALLGAGYAIAVGYALVALGYHLPSDVLGGYLVAATFTLAGAAALAALEARLPARAPGMTLSALQHPTALAAGAGIALLGIALTAGLAAVLHR